MSFKNGRDDDDGAPAYLRTVRLPLDAPPTGGRQSLPAVPLAVLERAEAAGIVTPPREQSVRRAVTAYLRSLAPRVAYRSNPASPYGQAGDPDLFCCVGGQLVCLELKRPGWQPTPGWLAGQQSKRLKKWAEAGAIAVVVRSRAEAETVMAALLT